MKAKLLIAVLFSLLTITNSYALFGSGVTFDPIAKIQRLIIIAEQKLQTLKTFQLVRETINNVRTAERMYEMGKRGYERLKDPDEWRDLKRFAMRRMEMLLDPDTDPYNSSLARIIGSLDSALDNYLMAANTLEIISTKIDSIDSRTTNALDSIPFVGRWDKGEKWAKNFEGRAYAKRYGTPQDVVKNAESKYKDFEKEAEDIKAEKKTLDDDSKKLNAALLKSQDSFAQLRFEMENRSGKDGAEAGKLNALQVRKASLEQLERAKDDLDKRKIDLTNRAGFLASNILEQKDQIDRVTGILGFEGTLRESWVKVSLSSMAELSNHLEAIENIFFQLLVVTLALGLLWHGICVYQGREVGIPHDIIVGVIGAFLFLFPASPIAIHKITRMLAIWIDGLTALFAKEAGNPVNSLSWMLHNTMGALNQIEGDKSSMLGKVVGSIVKGTGPLALIHTAFFGAVGFLVSLAGTISVFGSLLLRNLLFWVLMILSPAFIFLAPLPYARKKLLPAWGGMVYGTVLWGPVIYILLMAANLMIQKMTDIAVGTYSSNPLMDVFVNAFSGSLLVFAMVLAPLMAIGITMGSFGAASSVMGSVSGSMVAAGSSFAVVGSGLGMRTAGGALCKSAGTLNRSGNFLTNHGFKRSGKNIKNISAKVMNAGFKVGEAGRFVSSLGANIAKRNTGLEKIIPKKSTAVNGFTKSKDNSQNKHINNGNS